MLKLAESAEQFLRRHWQKLPLFIPQGAPRLRPSMTRNELAWLSTLDDVESRIVFTDRGGERTRYRAESGPFDEAYLAELPPRDWTLLVHDVEKHLPDFRRLFDLVPFIPDWRIDDLMVSFAAPGGGVGPHRDNYDVFLCQGIGVREWRITLDDIEDDPAASSDLALTREFVADDVYSARTGDVLYLPPGTVHWGTARRACLTYSIGMRAPRLSDFDAQLPDLRGDNPFYADPDLTVTEARPGHVASESIRRARRLVGTGSDETLAVALGRFASQTKDWIAPESPSGAETDAVLEALDAGASLRVHGMARLAWDDRHVYVNGNRRPLPGSETNRVAALCEHRRFRSADRLPVEAREVLHWMLESGAFEIPGNS